MADLEFLFFKFCQAASDVNQGFSLKHFKLIIMISYKKEIRELKVGASIDVPIGKLETTRNNVSLLNSKHYLDGKKWVSNVFREKA